MHFLTYWQRAKTKYGVLLYIQDQSESLSQDPIKYMGPSLESGIKDPILQEGKGERVPEG